MSPVIFKYLITFLFLALTYYLSYKGMKKTKDLKGFSIGNKDLNPVILGITMAASISSTATFVINPGFVYTHGLSAYLHYGVAASLGIFVAFLLITRGFRRLGASQGSLTIPHWVYQRFQSRPLSLFFALINLVSITFVVLILVGCSLLMSQLFGLSQTLSLTLILFFVFSYVLMGGSYAHVYTNSFQGFLMLLISLFLFTHGLKYFDIGFIESLKKVSYNYAQFYNPDSALYYDFLSVFLSGFVITFALMLQPHILSKVLYIKNEKDVNKFIATTVIVGFGFSLILFVGFYAKLSGTPIKSQDAVVAQYIFHEFGQSLWGSYFLSFMSISLLAAGLSTLDGILVALSSMVVNDVYLPYYKYRYKDREINSNTLLKHSRIFLVIIGLISYLIALKPPQLVGLFAQKGVYALAAASVVPILWGIFVKKKTSNIVVFSASLIGFFGHLMLNTYFGFKNPAVSSTYAIFASVSFTILYLLVTFLNTKKQTQSVTKGWSL